MYCLFFILIFLCAVFSSVHAAPRVQHTRYGIVAHPDDTTAQCLGRVCIGNEFASRNLPHLHELGITHVVSAIGCNAYSKDETTIKCLDVKMVDSPSFWNRIYALQTLSHSTRAIRDVLREENTRVLVHCAAGVSRSSSIVIAHLLLNEEYASYDEALQAVRAVRPVVQPNTLFEHILRQLAETRSFDEIDVHEPYEWNDPVDHNEIVFIGGPA